MGVNKYFPAKMSQNKGKEVYVRPSHPNAQEGLYTKSWKRLPIHAFLVATPIARVKNGLALRCHALAQSNYRLLVRDPQKLLCVVR
jgi:hypothetical protein